MADRIAIMNAGRIEQLGAPSDLYERPQTAFVASFLGISNLLPGTVTGPGSVRLDDGTDVRVPEAILNGRSGKVAVGVRPEKIRLGHGEENRLTGRLLETAYVGVATQYVLETRGRQRQRLRPEQRARRRRTGAERDLVEPRLHVRRRFHGRSGMTDQLTQAAAARAGSDRRSRDHVPGHPRRLRQQRHEGLRRHHQRRAAARQDAALLELDALHRRRREDEEPPDAERLREEDRRPCRLHRGHQRQRRRSSARSRARSRGASRSTATSSSSPTTRGSRRSPDQEGLGRGLYKAALPNIKNLVAVQQHPNFDPNRDYTLPWQSGMTGIAYNDTLTDPVLSVDDLLENPKLKGKITVLNSMGDAMTLVMLANGDDPTKVTDKSWNARLQPDQEGRRQQADPPVHGQRLRAAAGEGRPRRGDVVVGRHRADRQQAHPLERAQGRRRALDGQHADPDGRRRLHRVGLHELRLRPGRCRA